MILDQGDLGMSLGADFTKAKLFAAGFTTVKCWCLM